MVDEYIEFYIQLFSDEEEEKKKRFSNHDPQPDPNENDQWQNIEPIQKDKKGIYDDYQFINDDL